MNSDLLKIKVVEGRKFDSFEGELELNQLRPIVQIQFKYEYGSTKPSQIENNSPKWDEIFNFHVFNDKQYFVLYVYNGEIKEENLLGETRIGIISFKDQEKLDAWFPFYYKNKKKYSFMGEIHIIGKYVEGIKHDEQETDPDFISSKPQNNVFATGTSDFNHGAFRRENIEERREKEKLENERKEREKKERERKENERLERERKERERKENERKERERKENERLERERKEKERKENEKLEKQRKERERLEREKKENDSKERIKLLRLIREGYEKKRKEKERKKE